MGEVFKYGASVSTFRKSIDEVSKFVKLGSSEFFECLIEASTVIAVTLDGRAH